MIRTVSHMGIPQALLRMTPTPVAPPTVISKGTIKAQTETARRKFPITIMIQLIIRFFITTPLHRKKEPWEMKFFPDSTNGIGLAVNIT